ncbi:MAG TPA: peptidoglycan DD-metalloendopeptidase family protein, partial [bacterium]|nr:peptidoglycan DD-metalloendopeptidase family protein [bacterium]
MTESSKRAFSSGQFCCQRILSFVLLLLGLVYSSPAHAQVLPGPYESLPFEEAYIIEAWYDLLSGTGIADWTGYTGTSWVSPNAYNGHTGTDYALETGTPIYAPTSGQVAALVTNVPENSHPSGYGNYVRLAIDGTSPMGENLDLVLAHLLPNVPVSVGQRVNRGDVVGYSDNTGNSTSEHLHFESKIRNGAYRCPFYYAHFKYPVMFNPNGIHQMGHIVRIKIENTPIRSEMLETSVEISNAYQGQMFFSSYWQRGYYRVFIPNNRTYRFGWLKATEVQEVFAGSVLQTLPDDGEYVHTAHLANPYSIRADPTETSETIGQIFFGGARVVADETQSGWYRIPVPDGSRWGWIKPDARMVVYPDLCSPEVDLSVLRRQDFPIRESFSTLGRSMFGRPKFNRGVVKEFSPSSPNGDGKAVFITDATNSGNGVCESVIAGRVEHRNYFVQVDVYLDYKPEQRVSDLAALRV